MLTHRRTTKPGVHDADANADTDTAHPRLGKKSHRPALHRHSTLPLSAAPTAAAVTPSLLRVTYSLPTLSTASVVWSLRRICSVQTRPLRDPLDLSWRR